MAEKNELQKVMAHIGSWGRQTIAFAMSIRAERVGNPIDGPDRVATASKEANALSQELWESAFKECSQPVQPPEMIKKFTSKVFDWSIDHLTG